MIVLWSPHAETLLDDIVIGIAEALSIDDGLRWEGKLRNAAADIGDFPFSGPIVPAECFHTIPANADRLRQVIANARDHGRYCLELTFLELPPRWRLSQSGVTATSETPIVPAVQHVTCIQPEYMIQYSRLFVQ